MKDYTSPDPKFSKKIPILEVGDTNHADNVNAFVKPLFENTLINHAQLEQAANAELVEYAFYSVFTKMPENEEKAMTLEEINTAISTAWNGEASPDPKAMTPEEINTAISTAWNGETSSDPTALSSAEIEDVIN